METLNLSHQFNKSWLINYKVNLLWIVIIAAVILGGLKYFYNYRTYKDLEVNKKFHILLIAISEEDHIATKMQVEEILRYSDRTPYPRLAGILWAKVLIMDQKLEEAIKLLELITNRSKKLKDPIWDLANLRMIKALLMLNKYDEAEKIIQEGLKYNKFIARYKELYGDLLLAQHKYLEANKSYNEALEALPEKTLSPWLDLKKQQTEVNLDVLKLENS